jgi:hypothetical protein
VGFAVGAALALGTGAALALASGSALALADASAVGAGSADGAAAALADALAVGAVAAGAVQRGGEGDLHAGGVASLRRVLDGRVDGRLAAVEAHGGLLLGLRVLAVIRLGRALVRALRELERVLLVAIRKEKTRRVLGVLAVEHDGRHDLVVAHDAEADRLPEAALHLHR